MEEKLTEKDDKDSKSQEEIEKIEISSENGSEASSSSINTKATVASACATRNSITNSDGDKTEKLLKILQFKNPGPQYSSFDPDKSRREQRKVKQLFSSSTQSQTLLSPEKKDKKDIKLKNPTKRRNYHDKYGVRLLDGKDVCDCQQLNCPGCHFPCGSCSSEKCGVECRCGRRWTYEELVEIENPYAPRYHFAF